MTLLFVLLLVYAFLFVIDRLYVQPYRCRCAQRAGRQHTPGVYSFAIGIVFFFFCVLVALRTFVVDAYHVPTPSMLPVIAPGELIWVNRFAYGLRSPWDGRVLVSGGPPERGDVLAFRYPREPRNVYAKRLIGVPGDRIELNGHLSLNGQVLAQPSSLPVSTPVLLGTASFMLLVEEASLGPSTLDLVVPDGHYFVLGDNLSHSQDSRHWGFVSDRHLIGRLMGAR